MFLWKSPRFRIGSFQSDAKSDVLLLTHGRCGIRVRRRHKYFLTRNAGETFVDDPNALKDPAAYKTEGLVQSPGLIKVKRSFTQDA